MPSGSDDGDSATGPGAGELPLGLRKRDPAQRPRPLRPALPAALAHAARARPASRPARCRLDRGAGDVAGGAPRHAQDEGLRPFSHAGRCRRRPTAARRLVRARASHRRGDGTVLRAPLHDHALGHPDAAAQRPLGRRAPVARPARTSRPGAAGRRRRAALAHLLREHLQPGAPEGEGDAKGDAEALLAELAGSPADRPPDRRRGATEHGHDRTQGHRPRQASPCHDAAADARPRSGAWRRRAAQPASAARCPRTLPRMPDRRARDAGRARRRAEAGAADVRRRATGRPGRPAGQALRRPGRATFQPRARTAGHRARRRSTSPMRSSTSSSSCAASAASTRRRRSRKQPPACTGWKARSSWSIPARSSPSARRPPAS